MAEEALAGLGARGQAGVPMIWLPLPAPWTATDFVARAAAAGRDKSAMRRRKKRELEFFG